MLDIYNHYVEGSTATFDEEPLDPATWRSKFDGVLSAGLPWIVAESESGEVLGYAYVMPWKSKPAYRYTVEDSIYLHRDATGLGLGSLLLADLIERAAACELRQIVAVIADQGAAASIALHDRFGFVEAGRLDAVGRKFDRWIGTILMQKSLGG